MSTPGRAGNGDWTSSRRQLDGDSGLVDQGRQVQHDAEALIASLRETSTGVQDFLAIQVEQRPYSTLGMAAGVGYLLGGGLSSRLTVLLLGAGWRVATALVAREFGNRILPDTNEHELPK